MTTPLTLSAPAQSGLDYLKSINPSLASTISSSGYFNQSEPIDANKLTSGSSVNVPTPSTPPVPNYQNVQVTTPVDAQVTALQGDTPEETAIKTDRTGLVTDITTDTTKLGTKSATQTQLEKEAGLPGLNSQLTELNAQIKQTQADAFAATNKSEDRLAPTFAINGEQAQIERQRAVKTYGLAAAAEAIQGNIALATDHVTKALAAQFDPLEAEIANKKYLLEVNYKNFDEADKKRADALNIALDKQKQDIADQKATKDKIYQVMLTASQNGADNVTLNKILAARSPEDAIAAAGKYTSDPLARQQAEANLKLTDANITKALADAQKARSGAASGGVAGLSQEAIDQQAQNYLITGKLSTIGNGGAAAKLAILNRAAELASGPGGVPAAAAKYAAAANAVKTRTDSLTKMLAASSNLDAQFARLGQLSGSVNVGSIPFINSINASFKRGMGSTDAAAYLELINTIRQDYSSMQAAVAGSQGAEYFSRSADAAIPNGLTPEQYATIYQTLKTSSANAQQAIQGEINNVLDSATTPASSTDQYASYRSQLQTGEILVSRNGAVGAIPAAEFNPKTDKKL
jgi:hypothetical protein